MCTTQSVSSQPGIALIFSKAGHLKRAWLLRDACSCKTRHSLCAAGAQLPTWSPSFPQKLIILPAHTTKTRRLLCVWCMRPMYKYGLDRKVSEWDSPKQTPALVSLCVEIPATKKITSIHANKANGWKWWAGEKWVTLTSRPYSLPDTITWQTVMLTFKWVLFLL